MKYRQLGHSGLTVSTLSFGAMTFGDETGRVGDRLDHSVAARMVDLCRDAGVNAFDTADVYSKGRSEEMLGAALGQRRKDVLVATKVFGRMGPAEHDIGLSRRHIVASCEASLRRLRTEWIDLYQMHNFDGQVPLDETLRAFEDLVRDGKIRYVGCSNFLGWQLVSALWSADRCGCTPLISQQIQYSLMVRDAENELLPAGIAHGVGALIWSPLAQGFLTGKFDGVEKRDGTRLGAGGLKSWDTERGHRVVDELRSIAGELPDATPAQIALAWTAVRPGVSSLIVGARTEAQLIDNLNAATLELDARQVERLERASQQPSTYPDSHQRFYSGDRNPVMFPRHKAEA